MRKQQIYCCEVLPTISVHARHDPTDQNFMVEIVIVCKGLKMGFIRVWNMQSLLYWRCILSDSKSLNSCLKISCLKLIAHRVSVFKYYNKISVFVKFSDTWPNCFMLGDTAYYQRIFMMRPYINPETEVESDYNMVHAVTRYIMPNTLHVS